MVVEHSRNGKGRKVRCVLSRTNAAGAYDVFVRGVQVPGEKGFRIAGAFERGGGGIVDVGPIFGLDIGGHSFRQSDRAGHIRRGDRQVKDRALRLEREIDGAGIFVDSAVEIDPRRSRKIRAGELAGTFIR